MINTVWVFTGTDADEQTLSGFGLKQLDAALAAAVKIGKSVSAKDMPGIISFLKNYSGPIVLDFPLHALATSRGLSGGSRNLSTSIDPVDKSRDGGSGEQFSLKEFFCFVDVLVLDAPEAESLLNRRISTNQSLQEAANELLSQGAKSVLLKGTNLPESFWSHDYWTNGATSFWLTKKSFSAAEYPETGDVFSAAIVASLALGYSPEDSIVIATMYVHQAVRLAQTSLYYGGFPEDDTDLPYLASTPLNNEPQAFKRCHRLGLYPVVDSPDWVERLLNLGVKTIQLRIKTKTETLEEDMKRSIALAKKHGATLFINDYWDLALKLGADAVHLGQSDLDTADIDAIRRQGLLLGVSTHCYYEVARAHAICPSYVAIGPIYPTTSKEMPFSDQGVERLQRWQRTLDYPLVAIGGITLERMPDVVATGVQGVALISAITEAPDPQRATQELLRLIE